jgi:hypothetical protein
MRIRWSARQRGSYRRLTSPSGESLYGPIYDPIRRRKWEQSNHEKARAHLAAQRFSLYDEYKLNAAYVRLEIESAESPRARLVQMRKDLHRIGLEQDHADALIALGLHCSQRDVRQIAAGRKELGQIPGSSLGDALDASGLTRDRVRGLMARGRPAKSSVAAREQLKGVLKRHRGVHSIRTIADELSEWLGSPVSKSTIERLLK